jgi:inhibitor of cysteine peptidase
MFILGSKLPAEITRGRDRMRANDLDWVIIVVLCAWTVIGCGSDPLSTTPQIPEEVTVAVTAEQNGTQINLGRGDFLEVTLESNPTTGYRWEVVNIDEVVLRPLGESTFRPSSGEVGAGGTETFRFEAVGEGTSVLGMIYHRSFEEDEEPLDTFTLRVFVE